MTPDTRTAPEPSPSLELNRAYFAQIRNQYFGQAAALFQQIYASPFRPLSHAPDLERFARFSLLLDSTFEFSQQAIRGLTRNRLSTYSYTQHTGVLAEEVLVVHFLEEIISTAAFLSHSLKTARNILHYQTLIQISQKEEKSASPGYLEHLSEIIAKNQKKEVSELRQILQIIHERLQLVQSMLAVVKKLQGLDE